ncbi:MAG: alpha/beta hydrolase [Roseburia sp.]|nr:alpha/beta hydrolase [Roseburia sp.]
MCDVRERIFWENRKNLQIYAKEFIRKDALKQNTKLPAIIISHGFGGNCDELEYYCKSLVQKEYAIYCFDFCGGSMGGKSQGSTTEMTIQSECEDLIQILHNIQSLSYIDAGRISLMGFSQGGFISALTAAQMGDRIESLILLFPAFCIPDHARLGILGGASYDAQNVPDIIECPNGMKLSREFHEKVVDMDPFLEIRKYKGRTLLIHGMQDDIVNYSYAVRAKECYEEEQCRLMLIRDAGHGFTSQQDESAMIAIEHFLDKKEELLTIQIIITGYAVREERNDYKESEVYFTGYCDNKLFKGCVMPEGIDVQKKYGNDPEILNAKYTLIGIDKDKNKCSIHIENQKNGTKFKPVIQTDSKALAYLTKLDLTASLEGFPGGLTVRIFG